MPPVVAIVGRSESGKTTLLVKLVEELRARGYRIATAKHVPREVDFDRPGKDSWRHIEAGSVVTTLVMPDKAITIRQFSHEPDVVKLAEITGEDCDLLLAEGFKESDVPKIEAHRREIGPPLEGLSRLIGIVTDEPLQTRARQFSWDDIKMLTDLLESGFILPAREHLAFYVNGKPLVLTSFPKEIITNILLAVASSLKDVNKVSSLDIHLRIKNKQKRKQTQP